MAWGENTQNRLASQFLKAAPSNREFASRQGQMQRGRDVNRLMAEVMQQVESKYGNLTDEELQAIIENLQGQMQTNEPVDAPPVQQAPVDSTRQGYNMSAMGGGFA